MSLFSKKIPLKRQPRIIVLYGSYALFGAERGNLEALLTLKLHGAEVLCLISDSDENILTPPALDERGLPWRKVPYFEIRSLRLRRNLLAAPWRWFAAQWSFFKAVRDFKPTHIHAYGQWYVFNFLPGLWLTQVPLIFRAGDQPILHRLLYRVVWRFIVSRTAQFVANSEFIARSLRNNGVPNERITLIYNKPPGRLNLELSDFAEEFPAHVRVITFLGQIAEHKGPHLLVAAFKRLASEFPDIQLAIAGRISEWSGDQWARSLRDSTINDLSIGRRVKFLGLVDNVPALLARSELVVVPSLFEDPSPNVIIEAKFAGRACIGFPRGGIPELINDGVDGMICEDATAEALYLALRRYCEDKEMAALHGDNCADSIEKFGGTEFSNRWSAVYARAMQDVVEGV